MSIFDKHQSFLFSNDMENDDLMSEIMFAQELTKQAQRNPSKEYKLTFLVGEGDAGIKVASQKKVIDLLKEQGLLSEPNITTEVIRGYTDKTGSQARYENDGQAFLTEGEIQAVKGQPGDRVATNKAITTFLKENPNTAVIGIKPHREFMSIAETDASVFKNHTYYFTGSYNNRALWNRKCTDNREETKQAMIDMLGAFKNAYMFESFSAHKMNSTSSTNNKAMFDLIKQAPEGSLLHRFAASIESWNAYMLDWDRQELPQVIDRVIASTKLLANERDSLIAMVKGKACELSSDDQAKLSTMRDSIWKKSEALKATVKKLKLVPADSADLDQESVAQSIELAEAALSNLQRLSRLLSKWDNITGPELQFVNADCAFIATLLNDDVVKAVTNEKCDLIFDGDFSAFEDSETSNFHICLPKGTTVEAYKAARTNEAEHLKNPKEVPLTPETIQFARDQQDLFNEFQKMFLASIEALAQSTPKAQVDAGAGAGAGAGAPILHAAGAMSAIDTGAGAAAATDAKAASRVAARSSRKDLFQ